MKKKSLTKTKGKKPYSTQQSLIEFLILLNRVSKSGVTEFCTPGHKAGRGFKTMLLQSLPPAVPFPFLEEV